MSRVFCLCYPHLFERNEDGLEETGLLIFFRSIASEAVSRRDWLEGIYEFVL